MKLEVDMAMLVLFLFTYILLLVVLLEIYYFEMKLTDVIVLLNHLAGVG